MSMITSSLTNQIAFAEYFTFRDNFNYNSWKTLKVDIYPFHIRKSENAQHQFACYKPLSFESLKEYNLFLAHQKALAFFVQEKSNFNKSVLFINDVKLANDTDKFIENLEYLNDKFDWDMLYLDCEHYNNSYLETNNPNLLRLVGSTGWNAVIISYKMAEILLNNVNDYPYDLYCAKHIHHKYRCYSFYPSLIQKKNRFEK